MIEYDGWVYYPHPETKKTHFQNPSLVEVITHLIPEIQYGDAVEVELNTDEITVRDG
jgi:phage pi2 protein 07